MEQYDNKYDGIDDNVGDNVIDIKFSQLPNIPVPKLFALGILTVIKSLHSVKAPAPIEVKKLVFNSEIPVL